ncbi:hypothetical protein BED41_08085 [Cloacibacillus porcorum]|uniref:Tyr recombinase domain-containing protein n=1 Tax=Cloacibacillus porcorum TaxID=1197717 RepID=A0A1B2I500_9BACT|nr:hypothetical protein BED41_08085 [Cloacibacillus porcorum]
MPHLYNITCIRLTYQIIALFSLQWEDIDFNAKTILLHAASAKSQETLIIPINDIVYNNLELWQKKTEKIWFYLSKPKNWQTI